MLTSSSGTNYGLNEHEGVDQYGSFSIPSELDKIREDMIR